LTRANKKDIDTAAEALKFAKDQEYIPESELLILTSI
jgi:hypothetical protein